MRFTKYVIPAMAVIASTAVNASANETEWTGPYVGAQAGYTSLKPKYSEPLPLNLQTEQRQFIAEVNPNTNGISGGVLAGYNVQANGLILGIEADFALTSADTTVDSSPEPDYFNNYSAFDLKWNGHVRARIGYPVGKTLVYAAGGLALARLKVDDVELLGDVPGEWGEQSKTLTGFSVGGGVEHAITNNLTIRAEYLYDNYAGKTGIIDGPDPYDFTIDPSAHNVRAAVSYRF